VSFSRTITSKTLFPETEQQEMPVHYRAVNSRNAARIAELLCGVVVHQADAEYATFCSTPSRSDKFKA